MGLVEGGDRVLLKKTINWLIDVIVVLSTDIYIYMDFTVKVAVVGMGINLLLKDEHVVMRERVCSCNVLGPLEWARAKRVYNTNNVFCRFISLQR